MEKDKVLDWLARSKKFMDEEKYDQIREDVYKLDTEAFMDKWDSYLKSNVSGWIDYRKPKEKDLTVRLREDFGDVGFNPSERWKNEVYKKRYSDIPRERFEENLAKMKGYHEEYEKEKTDNMGRRERIKEMENIPWYKNILMNEYSKQRYIEDPDASIWGEQGKFNPYSREGQAELADNILHFTSLVPDTYPGMAGVGKVTYSTLGGPVTRALRNLIVDSDIKEEKPFTKLAQETGVNVGTSFGPTAWVRAVTKRGQNIAKSAGYFDDIALKKAIAEEGKAIDAGIESLGQLDQMSHTSIMKKVNGLPNSSLKNDLTTVVSNPNFNKEDVAKVISDYIRIRKTSSKEFQDAVDVLRENKFKLEEIPGTYGKAYSTRQLLDPQFGKMKQLGYGGATIAPVGIDLVARDIAQGEYEGDPKVDYDEETVIAALYPKWERGFVPKKGDKYYEIYEKWDSERNKEK